MLLLSFVVISNFARFSGSWGETKKMRDHHLFNRAEATISRELQSCAELCYVVFPYWSKCFTTICVAGKDSTADEGSDNADVVLAKKWAPRVECFNTPECQHLSDRAMWHTCVSTHCRSRRGANRRLSSLSRASFSHKF